MSTSVMGVSAGAGAGVGGGEGEVVDFSILRRDVVVSDASMVSSPCRLEGLERLDQGVDDGCTPTRRGDSCWWDRCDWPQDRADAGAGSSFSGCPPTVNEHLQLLRTRVRLGLPPFLS